MPATRSLEWLVGNSQMWSALSPFAIAPGSRANRKEPNYFLLFADNPLAISHPTDVGSGNVTAFSGLCLFPKAPCGMLERFGCFAPITNPKHSSRMRNEGYVKDRGV
jgi:hypothetical protein